MPLLLDKTYHEKGFKSLAGCDEAGRGPLAGPVVACCVILPSTFFHPLINDSKQLSEKQRLRLFPIILKEALSVTVSFVSPMMIDHMNILEASRLAMIQSLEKTTIPFDAVITDAMPFQFKQIPVFPHIGGDRQSMTIASASIVAKVMRDKYMEALDVIYPQYHFKKHKGYPTALHRQLLQHLPPIVGIHRFSFGPVKNSIIQD
jgi:ribonuclease HII